MYNDIAILLLIALYVAFCFEGNIPHFFLLVPYMNIYLVVALPY